jgi:hypothetical protein
MMSLHSRRELLAMVRPRYGNANRKDKRVILDQFAADAGYQRKYAIALLNRLPVARSVSDEKRPRKTRPRIYDAKVQEALQIVWEIENRPCGKRLAPFLPALVEALNRHGEIHWDKVVTDKLLAMSAATADRLLAAARASAGPRGKTTTKPGTLLKNQIPIRTFSEWDDGRPGFVEADLVAHCGATTRGEYVNTLTLTDVATQWTECLSLRNRSQIAVSEAVALARKLLPFALLGLDCDNGAEFINAILLRYCKEEKITFTRSRPYKKNDQCHVEQKNWSIVREHVGYDRLETDRELSLLRTLYVTLRLYVNFFQPCLKLTHKERFGAKVKKQYDKARTPYQRVMESGVLTDEQAKALKEQYESLNPAQLWRLLGKEKERLWSAAKKRNEAEPTNTSE